MGSDRAVGSAKVLSGCCFPRRLFHPTFVDYQTLIIMRAYSACRHCAFD